MLALPADELVRVYTVQFRKDVIRARLRGHFNPDIRHLFDEYGSHWADAYLWMREKMSERIENFSGGFPVWAWAKRPKFTRSRVKPKSDDEALVRLTALVPRGRILFSDYHEWHHPLNRWAITDTEIEGDEFEHSFVGQSRNWHKNRRYREAVMATWDKVLEFKDTHEMGPDVLYWRGSSRKAIPQLCIDNLQWNEIISVRDFG